MERRPKKCAEADLLIVVRAALETGEYVILPHARQRCREREISALDIESALLCGKRAKSRDRFDPSWERWSYGFEGRTIDGCAIRVVVVLLEQLGIVTLVRIGDDYE